MFLRPSIFTRTRAMSSRDRDHTRATWIAARPVESNSDATTLTKPHAIVESTISGATISRLQMSAISLSYEVAPRFPHQKQRAGDDHQVLGVRLATHHIEGFLNCRRDLAAPGNLGQSLRPQRARGNGRRQNQLVRQWKQDA